MLHYLEVIENVPLTFFFFPVENLVFKNIFIQASTSIEGVFPNGWILGLVTGKEIL